MVPAFDPRVRAEEKRASREEDNRALASNVKSPEDLRGENGKFAFPHAVVEAANPSASNRPP